MAFDAVDWQIANYDIEPVWIDSESDPDEAAHAYERAITQDGVQAGLLNWHSSVAHRTLNTPVLRLKSSFRFQRPLCL
jgi:branched-chain amino acid transport system substrate-binding protein